MGREIDERVVEMRFDNQKFEENANQSIETLKKLDKSLDFEHTGQSLDQIQNAANKLSFNPITNAIDAVQQKFNALEIMAVGAFMRIGGQIEQTAEKYIKMFTTDNIAAGWGKYAEKTNAVSTLVAQGYDLKTVNEQMNRLNWFTDETSYNFTDMAKSIGKFTASGQGLEESVTAMQGIALWASLSGQNAQTASSAMYQLSQALSAGYMRREDWKSIQNFSMDSTEFRQNVLDLAVELGTLKKNANDTYSSLMTDAADAQEFTRERFVESLTRGEWFTKDVMMAVYRKYGEGADQIFEAVQSEEYETASEALEAMGGSMDAFAVKAFKAGQQARSWSDVVDSVKDAVSTGWMQTFEYIFGNMEESIELWTNLANGLYDIFAEPGNRRNDILKAWYGAGGRKALLEGLTNIWDAVSNFTSLIGAAWENIFPKKDADVIGKNLARITRGFAKVTEGIKNFFAPLDELTKRADEMLEPVKEKVEEFNDDISKVKQTAEKAVEPLENLEEIARRVISGEFGNGETRFAKLTELYGGYEEIQNKVNELMGSSFRYKTVLKDESKAVDKLAEAQAKYKINVDGLAESKDKVSDIPSEKQFRRSEQVIETFAGLFSILKTLKGLLTPVVRLGGQLIGGLAKAVGLPFIDFILSGTSAIGRFLLGITGVVDNFTRSGKFAKAISTASATIHGFNRSVGQLSEGFFGSLGETLEKWKTSETIMRLGEAFRKLWGVLKEWKDDIFGNISDGFNKLVESVKNKGVDFSWLESLLNLIVNGLSSAIEFIVANKDSIQNIFSMFTGAVGTAIGAVGEGFKFLAEGIKEMDGGKSILEWLSEKFSGILDNLGTVSEKLTGAFKKFGEVLKKLFSSDGKTFDLEKFTALLKNVAIMAFFGLRLLGLFKAKESLLSIPAILSETLEELKDTLSAYQSKLKTEAIWNIAKSIGVLAASLFVLSLLDPNDLSNAAGALFVVCGALALVMNAFARIKEAKLNGKDDAATVMLSDFLDGIKNAFAKAAKMIGMAALMVGLAIAIGVVVFAIIKLKDQMSQAKEMWQAIGMIAVIVAMLGGVAMLCSAIGKNLTLGDALSFIAIALAIKMILGIVNQVVAMIKDPETSTNTLWQAIGMVSVLGLVLGAVVMLSKLGPGKGMLGTAATILILGIVMKILFSIVDMIAGYGTDQINQAWQGVTMLILLMGIITLLAYGAGNLGGMQEGAATLLGLVGTLAALGAVIVIVGKNAESGVHGMLLLAAVLIVLVAAAAAAQFLAVGMWAVANVVGKFGFAAAAIGVAALAIAAAFYVASAAIPLFFEGLAQAGDILMTKGPQIGVALLAIITIVLGVIIASQPNVIAAMTSLIGAISTGIANAVPTLLGNLWMVVLALGYFLIAVMPSAIQMLLDIVLAFWNNFAEAIVANSPRFLNAAHRMLYAIWDVVVDVITEIISGFSKTAAKAFHDQFHADLPPVLKEAGEEGAGALTGSFTEKAEEGLKEAQKQISGKFGEVTEKAFDDDISQRSGYKAGEATMQGQASGILENSGLPLDALMGADADLTQYVENGELPDVLKQYGVDGVTGEASGMTEAASSILSPAAQSSTQEGVEGVRSKYNDFVDAGKYIAKGVAAGMSDKEVKQMIDATGVNIGSNAANAVRRGAVVESPSKITTWVGQMIGEGLVVGMIDKVKDVKDSAKQMAEKGVGVIENATKGIYDILNQDLDLNPVIRPVLDDSGIQNGIGNVNSMFDRLALATGTTYTGNLSGIRSANNPNNLGEAIDKAVRKAIGDISDNVTDRLSTKTTIEVPLNIDGRRVAKATAEYTRNELARLDKYNSRKGGKV